MFLHKIETFHSWEIYMKITVHSTHVAKCLEGEGGISAFFSFYTVLSAPWWKASMEH